MAKRGPFGSGMSRHVEMNHSVSLVCQDEKDVKDGTLSFGTVKEVNRNNRLDRLSKKVRQVYQGGTQLRSLA